MTILIIILAVSVLVILFLYLKKVYGGHNLTDSNIQILLKSMPNTAIIYDDKLRVLEIVNPNGDFIPADNGTIIGLTLDEVVVKYPVFRECSAPIRDSLIESIKNNCETSFMYSVELVEGNPQHYEAKVSPLGRNKAIFFSQNVTKRVLAEKEIENIKNFFQSVLDNLPVGVFVKNINDNYKTIFFNKKLLEFFDYDVQIEDGYIISKRNNYERTAEQQLKEDINVAESGLSIDMPITIYDDVCMPCRYGVITKSKYSFSDSTSFIIGTLVDTTDLKSNEIEIENKRNEIIVALNAGNLSAWSYDVKGQKYSSIYGDTLSGESSSLGDIFDILHPSSRDTYKRFIDSILSQEVKTANAILRFNIGDGYRWFQTYASGIMSNRGTVTQIIGTQKDITEDLSKQHELEESKLKLELAMDAARIIMWDYDVERNRLSSPNPLSIIYNICCTMDDYIHVYVLPEYRLIFQEVVRTLIEDNLDRAEHIIRLKDENGSIQWSQFTGRVISRNSNGKALKIIGTREYITESVDAANELKETNLKTELILKSNHLVQWDYDLETKVFSSPDPTSMMYKGVTLDEYILMVHSEDIQLLLDTVDKLTSGKVQAIKLQIRENTPTGLRWFEVDCVPFKYFEDGRIKAITGLRREITDWKNMTNELIILRDKAEESNRLKSAFLANMSHEIRTPLNAIIGFSNLVSTCEDAKEKEEFCKVIETNNELLLQLINDILDLSKIEAGQLEFVYSEMDVTEMIESLSQVFKYKIKVGVELITVIPSEHCYICSERNRLAQVLSNFLSNAAKFTDSGSITIGYEYIEGGLKFYVRDSGKGIEKHNIPYVFDRFAKFDSFVQGTGLGLSICNTIVTKLNGEIFVASEVGVGTTFWFTMPSEILSAAPNYCDEYPEHIPHHEVSGNSKIILIVEDNYSNYILTSKILPSNCEIIHAKNGIEAVDLHTSHHPDLILMDIKMPYMNGIEATRIIRDRDKKVPIIALTAHAYDNDRDEAMAAGCSEFMTKPLDRHKLLGCMNKFM